MYTHVCVCERVGKQTQSLSHPKPRPIHTNPLKSKTQNQHHEPKQVQKLVSEKTEGPHAFLWQQQLRFYWTPPAPPITNNNASNNMLAPPAGAAASVGGAATGAGICMRVCVVCWVHRHIQASSL